MDNITNELIVSKNNAKKSLLDFISKLVLDTDDENTLKRLIENSRCSEIKLTEHLTKTLYDPSKD